MKMKVSGFLAFTILSISILSFGLTGAVNAQSQTVQDGFTFFHYLFSTESSSYTTGNSN